MEWLLIALTHRQPALELGKRERESLSAVKCQGPVRLISLAQYFNDRISLEKTNKQMFYISLNVSKRVESLYS
jgi:hypothetical protein